MQGKSIAVVYTLCSVYILKRDGTPKESAITCNFHCNYGEITLAP